MELKEQNNNTADSLLLHIQSLTATMDRIIAKEEQDRVARLEREAKREAEYEKEKAERLEREAKREAEYEKEKAERLEREAKREAEYEKEKAERLEREAKWEAEREKEKAERLEREAKEKAERLEQEAKEKVEREERETKEKVEREERETKWEREMKSMNKRFGDFTNSYGEEAEVLFHRSIDKTKKVANIQFDKLFLNLTPRRQGSEYDMVLVNGEYVGLVEVKRSASLDDLKKFIEIQTKTFRIDMPEYKDKKLICIIACIKYEKDLLVKAKEAGVCVLFKDGVHIKEKYEYLKEF